MKTILSTSTSICCWIQTMFMLYYGLFSCDLHTLDDLQWRSPLCSLSLQRLPLCTLLLCSMIHYDITMDNGVASDTHCNITMGNNIAMYIHCDVTMSNVVAMCTSQCILTLLWTSFIMYYYSTIWYFCLTSKSHWNCTHKPLKSISNQ